MKFFTVKPVIAMRDYMTLVLMFLVSNVCSNYAFNFHISMPLHMILKGGSLIANMAMGIVILNKTYDMWKYISVGMITIGIIICTLASGSNLHRTQDVLNNHGFDLVFWWLVGIAFLITSLMVAAVLGVYQEKLFKRYGKHPDEALFFTHALPLPIFLILGQSIWTHTKVAIESEPFAIAGVDLPILVIYYVINMVTQFLCIRSVYILMSECPSLTVTFVTTLRKFASLMFSIFYFKNPFTIYHWVGTIFVFIGTMIFTEMLPQIIEMFTTPNPDKINFKNPICDVPKSTQLVNRIFTFYSKQKWSSNDSELKLKLMESQPLLKMEDE